jgi:digeranylgeranylglycerophospholipid reductase
VKIAILGAGLSGLACAIECERLGIQAELFERHKTVGWLWPTVGFWPNIYYNNLGHKDVREYIKTEFGIDFSVLNTTDNVIMKSAGKQVIIKGKLGLTVVRGKSEEGLERQLLHRISKTPIYYSFLGDYNELAKTHDYTVVATGRETEARNMGLWQDDISITIIGAIAIGSFDKNTSAIYFNTEYAGTGYARLTPFNQNCAIIKLYIIGKPEMQAQGLFQKFIQIEKLDTLDYSYKIIPPVFSTGKVTSFQKGNVLLAGRAAGLVDSVLGVGVAEALISGTMAARAIAENRDYNSMVKPLQAHLESISSFRKYIDKFTNKDFDKLLSVLDTPVIKQLIYNTKIDFAGKLGRIFKNLNKNKERSRWRGGLLN